MAGEVPNNRSVPDFSIEENNILSNIFNAHINQLVMPRVDRFRVEFQTQRKTIDSLVNSGFIRVHNEQYRISLEAVMCLGSSDAKRLLDSCNELIAVLRMQYEINLGSPLGISDLEILMKKKKELISRDILYLMDKNFCTQSSADAFGNLVSIQLKENILDVNPLMPILPVVNQTISKQPNGENKKGSKSNSRWKQVRSLSQGGQAYTYLVQDLQNKNEKLYVKKVLKNINRLGRFKLEVEALNKIDHPNVLKIVDCDLIGDRPYFISEYCMEGSLEDKKYDLLSAIEIFDQICLGVEAIHNAKLVHRDLKPQNIFVHSNLAVVVGDLGLCFEETDDRLTEVDEAVGARWFMAPELEHGRIDDISPSADIYSLGKILYWLASQGKIFNREDHREKTFNLPEIMGDHLLEHLNNELDLMIVRKPEMRVKDISTLRIRMRKLKNLIIGRYRVLNLKTPQGCIYCGVGDYKVVADNGTAVRNFGLSNVSGNDLRVLACNECGNVQIFRMYSAKNKEWLGKDT